ncbi:TPA: metallophosphoesterase [Providencia stuartii]|nr:metallophosphoesterase [Providencia stuartii]
MIIGIISDIHQNSAEDKTVLAQSIINIADCGATALLMAGDIGDYHANRKEALQTFQNNFPTKYHQNLLLMLGNHDVRTGAASDGSLDPDLIEIYHDYLDNCRVSRYEGTMCIDAWIGGYHFLCLNTDVGLKDEMELNANSLAWLKEKLPEGAVADKPIFVLTHQAFNSTHWRAGLFGGFGNQDEELKQIFLDYPQIILLSGHIHNGFGTIEFIQRPFGTLIEIPSLTKGENGVTTSGTGYLLKVSDDKLIFEAWNFYHNTQLPEYGHAIHLPTLSVLAKKLENNDDEDKPRLLAEANSLMNKKYHNDIPSGDATYRPQEYYGLEKNYNPETWNNINSLRKKIIDLETNIEYHEVSFENTEIITQNMLNEALALSDNIAIYLKDGHWSPEIYISDANKKNQTIKINSSAGYKSTVITSQETFVISKGEEYLLKSKAFFDIQKTK